MKNSFLILRKILFMKNTILGCLFFFPTFNITASANELYDPSIIHNPKDKIVSSMVQEVHIPLLIK